MQLSGTLRSWNDDRGFGFIAPMHGGAELFVHISAFPRDGSRPVEGEAVLYELGRGKDGKPAAVRVIRKAIGSAPPRRTRPTARPRSRLRSLRVLTLAVMVIAAGAYLYAHRSPLAQKLGLPSNVPSEPSKSEEPAVASTFRCDGRTYCSQMTSCTEAKWFLRNCPGVKMDGNNDGVPCEQQWCTSPFAK